MSKKNKPFNIRTCIVTNQKLTKDQLIRLVVKDHDVSIDLTNKKQGRGYYIKPNIDVINQAIERKIFQKRLKVNITPQFIEELKSCCN